MRKALTISLPISQYLKWKRLADSGGHATMSDFIRTSVTLSIEDGGVEAHAALAARLREYEDLVQQQALAIEGLKELNAKLGQRVTNHVVELENGETVESLEEAKRVYAARWLKHLKETEDRRWGLVEEYAVYGPRADTPHFIKSYVALWGDVSRLLDAVDAALPIKHHANPTPWEGVKGGAARWNWKEALTCQ